MSGAKVWSLPKAGAFENLQLKEVTLPAIPAGHVLVKVHAIGLNFADVFSVFGLYASAPKTEFTPGLEYSGEVVELGEGATGFKVGDRVFGVSKFGAFASHLHTHTRYLQPIPEGWSYEQGCAFPVQALTAYYGLCELGNLKSGQTVLVHSAAGGVGILAIQILQKKNATVFGTVSSKEKADFLVSKFGLQPHQIIVRGDAPNFEAQLTEALQKSGKTGINIAFDSLGGEYFFPTYNKLHLGGRHVFFGSGSFMPSGSLGFNVFEWARLGYKFSKRPVIDPMKLMADNKAVMGFNLLAFFENVEEVFFPMFDELTKLKLDGPSIDKTFEFENLPEALRYFQSGKNIGKIVVVAK